MTITVEVERNRALLAWYAGEKRDLPWRGVTDPYLILVSEVMLQQTQVDRVIPYYTRFVESFPTANALAEAPFRGVAELWSGLGYNVRAKRLHDAAKSVAADGWPDSVAGLEGLPGVGPYTAQAIAAFAFGAQVAAIDTNVRRVLSRWHGEVLNGRSLPAVARAALGDADPVDWNQAMMDLGASVCRPRNPECGACPVSDWCAGPSAYQPPRTQARFEGSVRQVRGAIMRELIRTELDFGALVTTTGYPPERVADGLEGLLDDELIETADGRYAVAD